MKPNYLRMMVRRWRMRSDARRPGKIQMVYHGQSPFNEPIRCFSTLVLFNKLIATRVAGNDCYSYYSTNKKKHKMTSIMQSKSKRLPFTTKWRHLHNLWLNNVPLRTILLKAGSLRAQDLRHSIRFIRQDQMFSVYFLRVLRWLKGQKEKPNVYWVFFPSGNCFIKQPQQITGLWKSVPGGRSLRQPINQ